MNRVALKTATHPRANTSAKKQARFGLLLMAPFYIAFAGLMIAPLLYSLWLSLHQSRLVGGTTFTGLANYIQAFQDPSFLSGVWFIVRFLAVTLPLQIAIALVLALLLDAAANKLAQATKVVIFAPYAVPAVIGAIMWGFLYSPLFGPHEDFASLFGIQLPEFLSRGMIFWGLTNISAWQWIGYFMVLLYAALKGVDESLYEAAKIDGASAIQTALRIKVPLVMPTIILCSVFSIVNTLQLFTEPYILRTIASKAIDSAFTPNMYAYSLAFSYGEFNYASAISFLLAVIVAIGSYLFLKINRKRSGLA